MYTGYYEHYPNEDAVVYFVREIFPLIQRKVPNAKFYRRKLSIERVLS
jgi:hypothetical protein